jgi:hypothetical protein
MPHSCSNSENVNGRSLALLNSTRAHSICMRSARLCTQNVAGAGRHRSGKCVGIHCGRSLTNPAATSDPVKFRSGPSGSLCRIIDPTCGGRLDGYKDLYLYMVWEPPGPPPNSPPRARKQPPGAGNEVSQPSRKFPDRPKIEERPCKIQKHPQTSGTYNSSA